MRKNKTGIHTPQKHPPAHQPGSAGTPPSPKTRRTRHATRRTLIQAGSTLLANANLPGFLQGRIFKGATKSVCVPVLNCYSCPGAVGSCPIGALQAVSTDRRFSLSFYVLGLLALVGLSVGRLFCGWACPFGWFQDLLHRIPVRKRKIPPKVAKVLGWGKYLMLFGVVLLLPAVLMDKFGLGSPWFCKLVCPAGTLQAGLPILATNPPMRDGLGLLFDWKLLVLAIITFLSLFTLRPFCRFLCPLGAFYALFQRFSLYRMEVDPKTCTHCGACSVACGLDLKPETDPNHPDCIRCGACLPACPTGALRAGFRPMPLLRPTQSKPNPTKDHEG